jgi:hypothetical protein
MTIVEGRNLAIEILSALKFEWKGKNISKVNIHLHANDVAEVSVTYLINEEQGENVKEILKNYTLVEIEGKVKGEDLAKTVQMELGRKVGIKNKTPAIRLDLRCS